MDIKYVKSVNIRSCKSTEKQIQTHIYCISTDIHTAGRVPLNYNRLCVSV